MNVRYLIAIAAVGVAIQAAYVSAQDNSPAREITLIGCIMHESEYRDTYGPGLSGPRGPGIGGRDEYMLVDAHEVTSGSPLTVDAAAACPPERAGFPTAYELTGPEEDSVGAFVGQRVELTGIQKEAKVRPVGTSGTRRPTGGFDALGHELHLFEVEVASVQEPPPARAAAALPAPAPAPPSAPPAAPAPDVADAAPPVAGPAPEQQATAPRPVEEAPQQVARAELPRTATPLPLAALMGLLSLAAAAGIRTFIAYR